MPDIHEIQRRLRPALVPLGLAYAQLMHLRRWAFEAGHFSSWRPNCPVISVGNIGWGGSGKTPLCGHILRWAGKHEEHAVVLTRGYGAKPHRLPLLVTRTADPAQSGDEPLLLARSHPLARVVVDPKRIRSGPWAYERFDPDFVLLDDGFQHLPVARDLDLVLLTPEDYILATGIADPGQAAATAEKFLGRAPKELLAFPDHHAFTPADLLRIHAAASVSGGAHVVVTPKDAVKLSKLPGAEGFWALRTELAFGPMVFTDTPFDDWFAARFAELAGHYRPLAAAEHL